MDTNRLFLHSLIEEPHSTTLNDCTNKLNKLSYLSKKPTILSVNLNMNLTRKL